MLIKVTSANSLLVLLRMVFSLISQKALAILIGADGIAHVGNFKNIISFFEHFSILGTANGLVKYISEHKNDKQTLRNLFSTTFIFAFSASLLSFIVLFFFANKLNELIFGLSKDFEYIFKLFAFVVPFIALNAILNSLLNGLSNYKLYSKVNIFTTIVGTLLIVIFTLNWGLIGSLGAIGIIPLVHFLFIVFFSRRLLSYIDLKNISFNLSFKKQLLSYGFMTIIVVLSINVTDIAIRNLIENEINASTAGYWTAMTSLSKIYMQFLAALFPLYILPRYSEIINNIEFRNEVKNIYKLLIPIVFLGMMAIYLLRNFIIKVVYTNEFLAMSSLFKWQLIGDFVKFIALVLSYQFLAKKQVRNYIFTEIISVLLFYGFSVYFINIYGVEGIVIAHVTRYVLYLLVVIYILRHSLIGKVKTLD